MNYSSIFQEFEDIASQMGISILQEKGNFKGGFCLLETEKIIVFNTLLHVLLVHSVSSTHLNI